jgi:hypothetical protein
MKTGIPVTFVANAAAAPRARRVLQRAAPLVVAGAGALTAVAVADGHFASWHAARPLSSSPACLSHSKSSLIGVTRWHTSSRANGPARLHPCRFFASGLFDGQQPASLMSGLTPPQPPPKWTHTTEEIAQLTDDAIDAHRAIQDAIGSLTPEQCTFESVRVCRHFHTFELANVRSQSRSL